MGRVRGPHLWTSQSRLDNIPNDVFLNARRRANPYEKIGKSIFINRAAVKMANLDALYGLLGPPPPSVRRLVLLYPLRTLDLCG